MIGDMATMVQLKQRGTLTLPKAMREEAGVKEGDQFLAEVTADGILFKPVSMFPMEIYTPDRIKEFEKEEESLNPHRKFLQRFRLP